MPPSCNSTLNAIVKQKESEDIQNIKQELERLKAEYNRASARRQRTILKAARAAVKKLVKKYGTKAASNIAGAVFTAGTALGGLVSAPTMHAINATIDNHTQTLLRQLCPTRQGFVRTAQPRYRATVILTAYVEDPAGQNPAYSLKVKFQPHNAPVLEVSGTGLQVKTDFVILSSLKSSVDQVEIKLTNCPSGQQMNIIDESLCFEIDCANSTVKNGIVFRAYYYGKLNCVTPSSSGTPGNQPPGGGAPENENVTGGGFAEEPNEEETDREETDKAVQEEIDGILMYDILTDVGNQVAEMYDGKESENYEKMDELIEFLMVQYDEILKSELEDFPRDVNEISENVRDAMNAERQFFFEYLRGEHSEELFG